MFKRCVLCLVAVLIITGCSAQIGKQDFSNTIKHIEQALNNEDLAVLKLQALELKAQYDKHEWKIELLGDEGEYERLHESIYRLIAAIEAEEISDAKIELATIKTIVEDIYSL